MNSKDSLIKVLQAATSQDVGLVKEAELQLKSWESNQGFYSSLLEIFLLKNLDVNIRWMSIICLKNGVSKYWRKSGQTCLSEEEKVYIRNKIITVFDEEVIQLALQVAVIVGKIARIDIKHWPDAIHQTLEVVKLDKTIHQHRALLTLNQILKGLASKRLVADQLVFREISANIFNFLAEMNNSYFTSVTQSNISSDLGNSLEMSILLTKILRKLVVFGGPQNYILTSYQIKYLQICLQTIPTLLALRTNFGDSPTRDSLDKLLIFLMKTISEMQDRHSLSFVPVLEDTLTMCLQKVLSENGSSEFATFIIYCGNILRSMIRAYNLKEAKDEQAQNITRTAVEIKSRILTIQCIKQLVQHLIMSYFPMTEENFEEWNNDPEGYLIEEAGESHKFLLRPCIESLFVSLFYEFKSEINPYTINLTKEVDVVNMGAASDGEIMKVCCVYKSIGLASYELFHDLDFDVWFETKLINNLSLHLKPVPILQQYILWMIGEWINVKFSKNNRVILYQILSKVLSSCDDLVLKLTACKVLRLAIDDFDFVDDDFTPFVKDIFVALCHLLVLVEMCDTKMMVLNSLSIMIERINKKVRSEADLLLKCLPELWELSEAHNLLRGSVINVLVHLVKGLGNESMKVLSITLPIIQYSTSVDQPAHVYLLEDGLELWLAVLKNTNHLTQEILIVYKNILVLFDRASETLGICVSITKLYLLIDAGTFLREYSANLSKHFLELLGSIKPEPATNVAKLIKLSLQLLPGEFLSMFQVNLLDIMGNILKDELYPLQMVGYLSIMAYIILHQPAGFGETISIYCSSTSKAYDEVMERLLDIWLDKVDCMTLIDRKVSALALCSMIPHKLKFIMDRFALILDLCVSVMFELQKTQSSVNETIIDSMVITLDASEPLDEDDTGESRERLVLSHDPVYKITLLHYVQGKLLEAKQSYGDQMFVEAMETMDSAVAKQLLSLVNV